VDRTQTAEHHPRRDGTRSHCHQGGIAWPLHLRPVDLFEGFDGYSGYGVGILTNSNIRTVFQSIADIYGFRFSDTGDGFYFKKPGRDDAFSLDATLTTADLVFGQASAIESDDEATIRTPSRVELQYNSKDQGYETRPASFSMPSISNSLVVQQYSSPLVLTDEDAQTFVTEKYFELQASRRTHTFSASWNAKQVPAGRCRLGPEWCDHI
jgi:hypothetical protein